MRRWIILVTAGALVAVSGLAMASPADDGEASDTVFNYGYDATNQFLIWNITSLDYNLSEGPDLETLVEECDLGGGTISYSRTETGVDLDESLVYPVGDPCGELMGTDVTGPNGQVNHGMFMRAFNDMYEGVGGRGCLVRYLARSGLGKDDQQVTVGEADAELEPAAEGEAELIGAIADCVHGVNSHEDDAALSSAQHGHSSQAKGQSRDGRGRSASAPGHNK